MNKNIHETALVSENAVIGDNVVIGPFSVIESCEIANNVKIGSHCTIHKGANIQELTVISKGSTVYSNVRIGKESFIGEMCEIGIPSPLAAKENLIIGESSIIRSKSIFYIGSTFGKYLQTGHSVTVRENVVAGDGLQLGTLSDIQGDCSFGNYVKLHSNVHIGKHSKLHNYIFIFPYVVLTNDSLPPSENLVGVEIFDFAIIATMSIILPGLKIGAHALVGAGSTVTKNVEEYALVMGVPAKRVKDVRSIIDENGDQKYPWNKNFHRGYPEEIIKGWITQNK